MQMLYQSVVINRGLNPEFTHGSYHHLWEQALGSDHKNYIKTIRGRNELPQKGVLEIRLKTSVI